LRSTSAASAPGATSPRGWPSRSRARRCRRTTRAAGTRRRVARRRAACSLVPASCACNPACLAWRVTPESRDGSRDVRCLLACLLAWPLQSYAPEAAITAATGYQCRERRACRYWCGASLRCRPGSCSARAWRSGPLGPSIQGGPRLASGCGGVAAQPDRIAAPALYLRHDARSTGSGVVRRWCC